MRAVEASPSPSPVGTLEHLDLAVSGMTCAGCARRVERSLGEVEGVLECHVNFATRRASVVFDSGTTSAEALAGAVADAGYQAEVPRTEAVEETWRAPLASTRSSRGAPIRQGAGGAHAEGRGTAGGHGGGRHQ